MKKYLLLRNNQETGPFSLEELRDKELLTTDLIWVENMSTAWRYPTEIRELEPLTQHLKKPVRKIYVSKPWNQVNISENVSSIQALNPEQQELPPLGELKERVPEYQEKKLPWGKKNQVLTDILKIAALFAGMVIGAFMIKKMVDDFSQAPVSQMQVVPARILMDADSEKIMEQNIQTALLLEEVPAKAEEKPSAPVKKPRPTDIKKKLSIKGSEYKVGVLGGINGLQLKLYNSSPHLVDRVTVAIQYLKPNGEVVHTDQYDIYSLKPRSTRVFEVPDSRRGVKVKYKILEVHSNDHRKKMKEV